jgi:cytochrome c nitrite reductase small subunit
MNCHVMTDAYASWQRGSHGQTAVCNDCHVPHSNPAAKWAFKARDGMRHSYIYTMRLEPQAIRLSDGAKPVVQSNCLRCHENQLMMIRVGGSSQRKCWDCHTNIHGEMRSLSASPETLRPALPKAGL